MKEMIEDFYGEARGPGPGDLGTSVSRVRSAKRRTKGYVVLDGTWARRLGVRRSGGMYRIARWQLREQLAPLQQAALESVLCLPEAREDQSHFVDSYQTEAFPVGSARHFLASGLLVGNAAILVATPPTAIRSTAP